MKTHRIGRKGRRGQVMVEFVLTMLVSVPLILGLIAIGIRFVRELAISQVSRDLANMYSRGVKFTPDNPNALLIVQRLGPGFNFTATGDSVAILSEVRKITAIDCSSYVPPVPAGSCNTDKPVFEQRLAFGNPSVRASNYGTPVGLDSQGKTTFLSQLNNAAQVAQGFDSLLSLKGTSPPYLGPDGVSMITLAAEHAYMVEVIVNTNDLNIPGFMPQTQAYSCNVF